jgi:hypothetical protein
MRMPDGMEMNPCEWSEGADTIVWFKEEYTPPKMETDSQEIPRCGVDVFIHDVSCLTHHGLPMVFYLIHANGDVAEGLVRRGFTNLAGDMMSAIVNSLPGMATVLNGLNIEFGSPVIMMMKQDLGKDEDQDEFDEIVKDYVYARVSGPFPGKRVNDVSSN